MFKKVRKPGDYMLFVVFILLLSFLVNVYISLDNYKFKYRVGRESYVNIEKIRSTNQINKELLKNSIEAGSLDNMELLKLYNNYGEISDSMTSLWDEYSFYEENGSIIDFGRKKIEKKEIIFNDINGRIEEYLRGLMENEMKTQSYKIKLEGKISDNLKEILELSEEVDSYYNKFYEENLSGVENEEREKKVVKKYYWVDILEGLNIVNQNYMNIDISI